MLAIFLSVTAAILIGLAKGGVKGLGPIFVLLLVHVFGAKNTSGLAVPLFIVGDLLALWWYTRHIKLKVMLQFLPWALIGILIAVWVGKDLPEWIFKKGVAFMIISGLLLMVYWEIYAKKDIKQSRWLTAILGFGSGFYSMIGNFGGVFANIFFLGTKLPKNEIIGTSTLAFFFINIFKMPFHIFVWHTITFEFLNIYLYLVPSVIIGFFIGVRIIARVSETWFRKFLYIVTILGALFVLIN